MSQPTLRRLHIAAGLALAAHGCNAYADGSGSPLDYPELPVRVAPAVEEMPAASEAPPPMLDLTPTPEPFTPPEAEAGSAHKEPASAGHSKSEYANLRVERSARFDGYLTDGFGRALYMLVDDVAGSETSACLAACAREWPPFSPATVHPSAELDPADISRFHRDDGLWQIAYKGFGLYYRASELGTREVTGDGVDARWFVARDYLVFLSASRTFAPQGGTTSGGTFLTDGFGRTLYVCLDDQPRTALQAARSSCDTACTVKRPIFEATQTARTTRVPSVLDPSALRELMRPDGQRQLTYRGWPLYVYSGDTTAGATAGHNERAWRAIDPVSFGVTTP